MHEVDAALLQDMFRRYYFEYAETIPSPTCISQREFGYQTFNSGMVRHQKLQDEGGLHAFLVSVLPSDVYCSNAYYSFPDLPMNEKNWLKADLIFDIDAKDLDLPCRSGHTARICKDCFIPSGSDQQCSACGSARIHSVSLTCKDCINGSLHEVQKLIKILVGDLGICEEHILTYFSGNEGFHLHIHTEQFEELGSRERNEIVDYIRFNGAIPESFGLTRDMKKKDIKSSLPEITSDGWAGRVAKEIFGSKAGRLRFISKYDSDTYTKYRGMLQDMAGRAGARIDPQVTTDIHRIFRLPYSINGKSGMAKVPCRDLDSFDPYRDACTLDDRPVTVTAMCPIAFTLKGNEFGPYDMEQVSIPGYAAVYLICKGLATSSDA